MGHVDIRLALNHNILDLVGFFFMGILSYIAI